MAPSTDADAEKEHKRKRQGRKMGKLLSAVWQSVDTSVHDDLAAIGQKLDTSAYKVGKSGWTDFARDVGAVFTQHMGAGYVTT